MAIPPANRVPYEIIGEILAPLLKHSDKVFRDQSAKPLLDPPGFPLSSYLLVCKAWLRAAAPLLYRVIILRTTPQAEALQAVLRSNKELGLSIKKLRIEAGFPNAIHTILESAPNITDLFLSLFIWESDDVRGLCSGLPLISPRRVILRDGVEAFTISNLEGPRENRQIDQLFDTLVALIPKWDKLQTFDFPYIARRDEENALDVRAKALASALEKSQSLKILIMRVENRVPAYLRELVNVRSLKSIHFILSQSIFYGSAMQASRLENMRRSISRDPAFKALATFDALDDDDDEQDTGLHDDDDDAVLNPTRHAPAPPKKKQKPIPWAQDLLELQRISNIGRTVKDLQINLMGIVGGLKVIDPKILAPFTKLTRLQWSIRGDKFSWSKPPPGFSALPRLEEFKCSDPYPTLLDIVRQQPLNSLRDVELSGEVNVPASVAFLRCKGAGLERLVSTTEILIKSDVFNICTNLRTLKSAQPGIYCQSEFLTANFFACVTPQITLSELHFVSGTLLPVRQNLDAKKSARPEKATIEHVFGQLEPESFPALKEIQMDDIRWPISEREAWEDHWIPISVILARKGITVFDKERRRGPTGKRLGTMVRLGAVTGA
ncbi:hypothetical protein MVEN_01957600 [Mycena venus]|uniref:F-box domain-containing protein n=1 Tax=Mycena venus TaxID=2733690 RepID=A0A8H6XH47_9AGAR|nr:hypothetical protein MVEN_01957600 [Mycena venus]